MKSANLSLSKEISSNNCLMLNNQLNAIDPEVDASCTLCRIRGLAIRDSFEHGFFGCVSIRRILTETCSLLVPVQNVDSVEFRRMYWFGIVDDEVDVHVIFFFDILRYVMWKYKRRRHIPNFDKVLTETKFILSISQRMNRKFREGLSMNDMLATILRTID